ncbi:bifunctional DNA primase/polymerase [Catellatospora chokoriensis]|uniref:bifunctional DNA primase/polymerase n=1 Tax=Catellatospora chokoriensis TaxID=310353 RepID=UPI001EF317F5|nr:bifunctional DNA primase/polymerase [Catellatospora chokoriensis]
MHLQAAALEYTRAGWPVFLLGRTKRPLANCDACPTPQPGHDPQACRCLTCHGFYAATLDPRTLRRMLTLHPHGMLAIRTGAPSGLVVVDVDPDHDGLTTLRTLVARGLTPPTRYVRTGSGGLHLYYRHPGTHTRVPCSAGQLGPGIDVRADGGYVAAPPSTHPRTRRPYTWHDPHQPITEMAPALLTACQPAQPATGAAPPRPVQTRRAGAITAPDRLLASLLDAVRHSGPGRRRTTLYGSARGVARMVAAGAISSTDAYAALMEVGLAVGQTEKSSRAAIQGGFTDEGVLL